jgi:hypothetical protein
MFSRLKNAFRHSEHIKYPESNPSKGLQQNVPNGTNNARKSSVTANVSQPPKAGSSPTQGNSGIINGMRAMSPNGAMSPDPEELRRAISPTSRPQQNGVSQGSFTSKDKGKAPMRPRRSDDDMYGVDSGNETNTFTSVERVERAISPDNRAKSPTVNAPSNRALSPSQFVGEEGGQSLSRADIVSATDRSKSPVEVSYATRTASPAYVNGANWGGSDPEAFVSMQKREAWLKAALVRASRSGFVYADSQEPPEDLVLDFSATGDQGESKRVVEMVMNLKHMRASIQVRLSNHG